MDQSQGLMDVVVFDKKHFVALYFISLVGTLLPLNISIFHVIVILFVAVLILLAGEFPSVTNIPTDIYVKRLSFISFNIFFIESLAFLIDFTLHLPLKLAILFTVPIVTGLAVLGVYIYMRGFETIYSSFGLSTQPSPEELYSDSDSF